jgi:ASCH domain
MKTSPPPEPWYAISVKQPWAALLAHGVKSVEVRTWSTSRRGPLLIHASKIPDERSEAWQWVTTDALEATTKLRGGIIGVGELCGCLRYDTAEAFVADSGRHLNAPDWYVESGLFGLTFRSLRCVPFFGVPGNTYFFRVEGFPAS